LLNEQVGIVINGAHSNPGKDKSVFLRGAAGQYTVILVDGIPVSDPSGVGGAFDLRLLPIDQVARIEILKGSQSTLYGTDAIAGVINIITKKKGDKPVGGFGTVSYGSYNTMRGNVGVSGSSKPLDYNVSYTRFRTDGISEAEDQSGNGNFDRDGYDQNSVQLNAGWQPNQKLSLRPFVRYTNFNGQYDGGPFADDRTAVYTSRFLHYGLTGQYALSKGSLNLQYGRSDTERTFESAFGKFPYKGLLDNAEVFFNTALSNHVQLLTGLNFQNLSMQDENAVRRNPSATITSPYASIFVKDIKGFSAELGGRHNRHSQYGHTFTFSINPSYLIARQIKLFANYSTGFKAPTLNELYGQFGANEDLKPQESRSADAGVQYAAPSNKFEVRAAYFNRKIENAIIYGTLGYINLNQQNDYGFEVEPALRVNNRLSVRAFYAFVDGEVKTKTFAGKDTTFNNLIRRPRNSLGVNVGYQFSRSFFASLNLKTFGERTDTFFDLSDFSSKSITLSPYQLLDIYAEYSWLAGRLKWFADARNILNQRYFESYGYATLRFNVSTGVSCKL
jgi:vitamin B12 transporter